MNIFLALLLVIAVTAIHLLIRSKYDVTPLQQAGLFAANLALGGGGMILVTAMKYGVTWKTFAVTGCTVIPVTISASLLYWLKARTLYQKY